MRVDVSIAAELCGLSRQGTIQRIFLGHAFPWFSFLKCLGLKLKSGRGGGGAVERVTKSKFCAVEWQRFKDGHSSWKDCRVGYSSLCPLSKVAVREERPGQSTLCKHHGSTR